MSSKVSFPIIKRILPKADIIARTSPAGSGPPRRVPLPLANRLSPRLEMPLAYLNWWMHASKASKSRLFSPLFFAHACDDFVPSILIEQGPGQNIAKHPINIGRREEPQWLRIAQEHGASLAGTDRTSPGVPRRARQCAPFALLRCAGGASFFASQGFQYWRKLARGSFSTRRSLAKIIVARSGGA